MYVKKMHEAALWEYQGREDKQKGGGDLNVFTYRIKRQEQHSGTHEPYRNSKPLTLKQLSDLIKDSTLMLDPFFTILSWFGFTTKNACESTKTRFLFG